jgi:predicted RNase H-like HicB family nuclease
MNEIIFEVREDEIDGGFVATALGHAIVTQGETVEELREMVRDAVHCHFGDGEPGQMPKIICLQRLRQRCCVTQPGVAVARLQPRDDSAHRIEPQRGSVLVSPDNHR